MINPKVIRAILHNFSTLTVVSRDGLYYDQGLQFTRQLRDIAEALRVTYYVHAVQSLWSDKNDKTYVIPHSRVPQGTVTIEEGMVTQESEDQTEDSYHHPAMVLTDFTDAGFSVQTTELYSLDEAHNQMYGAFVLGYNSYKDAGQRLKPRPVKGMVYHLTYEVESPDGGYQYKELDLFLAKSSYEASIKTGMN